MKNFIIVKLKISGNMFSADGVYSGNYESTTKNSPLWRSAQVLSANAKSSVLDHSAGTQQLPGRHLGFVMPF